MIVLLGFFHHDPSKVQGEIPKIIEAQGLIGTVSNLCEVILFSQASANILYIFPVVLLCIAAGSVISQASKGEERCQWMVTAFNLCARSNPAAQAYFRSPNGRSTSVRRVSSPQAKVAENKQDDDDCTHNPDNLVHGLLPFADKWILFVSSHELRFGALSNTHPTIW